MSRKVFMLLFISCILLTGCQEKQKVSEIQENPDKIEIVEGIFAIDKNNPMECVGSADHVFVGTVEKNLGTEYEDITTIRDEQGNDKKAGSPFTKFEVRVTENIKGELDMSKPIIVNKEGGITMDGSAYEMYRNDLIPEEGVTYVFLVHVQRDGSNLLTGPNSNIPVDEKGSTSGISTFTESIPYQDSVQRYKDAFLSEIPYERDRNVSNDDVRKK